jgi:NAD(P)-dependent dehydrogenase (short-subunit alcohol dehydrogenase family)
MVTLAVRTAARGAGGRGDDTRAVPEASLECGLLDLTSLASVREFAEWFTSRHDRLGILVNNAA